MTLREFGRRYLESEDGGYQSPRGDVLLLNCNFNLWGCGFLGPHHQGALHFFMLVAADDAAGESEGAGLVCLE